MFTSGKTIFGLAKVYKKIIKWKNLAVNYIEKSNDEK